MNTLLLDQTTWDLVLDANGNIALASEPYSIAQDVASAIKLFSGELWYDSAKGVPYFLQILGEYPPTSLVKAELAKAALTVPQVVKARVINLRMKGRELSGIVEVIDDKGKTNNVSF